MGVRHRCRTVPPSLYDADLKGPAAIVIGSEGDGMGRLVAENCDFKVSPSPCGASSTPSTPPLRLPSCSTRRCVSAWRIKHLPPPGVGGTEFPFHTSQGMTMSDREDKKLNLGDELADVKSLIAGAEDGGFSLDDILAEYGVKSPPGRSAIPLRPSPPEGDGPDLPWPEPPSRRNRDNVVAFPGRSSPRRRTAPPPRMSPSRRRALRSPKGRPRRQTPSGCRRKWRQGGRVSRGGEPSGLLPQGHQQKGG